MQESAVFDSVPLDDLEKGSRYVLDRTRGGPIAGVFAGFGIRPGHPMDVILGLVGGNYAIVPVTRIQRITPIER